MFGRSHRFLCITSTFFFLGGGGGGGKYVLLKDTTRRPEWGSNPRPLDPESEVLTTRLPRPLNYDSETDIESKVGLTNLGADFLITLNRNIFYARHENDDIFFSHGGLELTKDDVKSDMLYTIRQSDIGLPVKNIIPFTIYENMNKGIVLVCALKNNKKEFVFIQPYTQGTAVTELLEIG